MSQANDPIRVLCVEDSRDSRDMLKAFFGAVEPDFEVTAVETAAEAIEKDGRTPFDAYVLDIWLPGMDGVDLCRRLRDRGRTGVIVFYSAMNVPEGDRSYVLRSGADEFLVKPNDLDKIVPTIKRLLEARPKGAETADSV